MFAAAKKVGQVTEYALKVETTSRVAIITNDYPRAVLEDGQPSSLEDILIEELCQSQERGINLSAILFRNGMMLVNCGSQGSEEWIARSVPQLKSWRVP